MEPLMNCLPLEGFLQTKLQTRIKGKAEEESIEPHNVKT